MAPIEQHTGPQPEWRKQIEIIQAILFASSKPADSDIEQCVNQLERAFALYRLQFFKYVCENALDEELHDFDYQCRQLIGFFRAGFSSDEEYREIARMFYPFINYMENVAEQYLVSPMDGVRRANAETDLIEKNRARNRLLAAAILGDFPPEMIDQYCNTLGRQLVAIKNNVHVLPKLEGQRLMVHVEFIFLCCNVVLDKLREIDPRGVTAEYVFREDLKLYRWFEAFHDNILLIIHNAPEKKHDAIRICNEILTNLDQLISSVRDETTPS
jgi:hypothetical protein